MATSDSSQMSLSSGIYEEPRSEKGSGSEIATRYISTESTVPTEVSNINYDITQPHKDNGAVHMMNGTSHGLQDESASVTAIKEQNQESDTKQAENTVATYTAPPSKSSSTPSDRAEDNTQVSTETYDDTMKKPEPVSGDKDSAHHTHPEPALHSAQRSKSNTYISLEEHKKSTAELRSDLKTAESQRDMAEILSDDVTKEKDKVHKDLGSATDRNMNNLKTIVELTQEKNENSEELKETKEEKRKLLQRTSILEDDLRKANEKIEALESENRKLREETHALSARLTEETRERRALQQEVKHLAEIIKRKCN